jgi:hypothetical protein
MLEGEKKTVMSFFSAIPDAVTSREMSYPEIRIALQCNSERIISISFSMRAGSKSARDDVPLRKLLPTS